MRSRSTSVVTRRDFCRGAVASGVGMALAGQNRPAAATEFPRGRYVDVHTHLGQTWNSTEPLSVGQLLELMDQNDIAQSLVLPLVSPESS